MRMSLYFEDIYSQILEGDLVIRSQMKFQNNDVIISGEAYNKKDFVIIDSELSFCDFDNKFNKRPIKTLKQVLNVMNKISKLNNKKSLINDKILETKRGFNNYLI